MLVATAKKKNKKQNIVIHGNVERLNWLTDISYYITYLCMYV